MTTANNKAVAISVDADVPEYESLPSTSNEPTSFPQLAGSVKVRGTLTLTPHILVDNTVGFEMASPVEGSKPVQLKAVASGEPLVIVAYGPGGPGVPLIGSLFQTRSKHLDRNELLIFITPTIQSEITAQKTVSVEDMLSSSAKVSRHLDPALKGRATR
jgi:hypothetical protein